MFVCHSFGPFPSSESHSLLAMMSCTNTRPLVVSGVSKVGGLAWYAGFVSIGETFLCEEETVASMQFTAYNAESQLCV